MKEHIFCTNHMFEKEEGDGLQKEVVSGVGRMLGMQINGDAPGSVFPNLYLRFHPFIS